MRSPLLGIAATAFFFPVLAPAAHGDGNNALGFFHREVGKVNFATAAIHSADSGTISLSTVPAGAVIRKVYYYYVAISNVIPTASTFAGNSLPIQVIGLAPGTSAGKRERAFRNDVTSIVTGNGSYSYSRTAFGLSRGAALVVLYEDATLIADWQIELHDGCHSGGTADGANGSWVNPVTYTGFTVDATAPREVETALLIQGGNSPQGERYLFARQADPLTILAGDNPATLSMEWDRFDVSSWFLGGETQARGNCSEIADAIEWMAGVLRVRITPPIVDITPPELTIAMPADQEVVAGSLATVTICVRDENGTTITSSPPLVWSPSTFAAPTMGESDASFALVEGANALTITATDEFGNSTTRSVTIRLDTVVPAVSITEPADGAILGLASATLSADVADATATSVVSTPAGIEALLVAGGGSVSGTVALAEGANTLSVSATDEAGHSGGTSITVLIDTTPPDLVVIAPVAGAVVGESPITLTVHVNDATATTVTFDGTTATLPAGGGSVSGAVALLEGANGIVVSATDAAGNTASRTIGVALDLTAPVVNIDLPADGDSFGPGEESIALIATIDDANATEVVSMPAGVATSFGPGGGIAIGAIELAEGANAITVVATDAVGRTGSYAITVVLDTTAPIVTIDSPAPEAFARGVTEFHASADDVAPGTGVSRVAFFVDAAEVASLEAPPFETTIDTAALADGPHELTAVATDGKGNAGTAASAIVVDNTAPVIVLGGLFDGGIVAGLVDFTAAAGDEGVGLVAIEMRVAGAAPLVDGSTSYMIPVGADTRFGQEDTTTRLDGLLAIQARAVDAAGNEAITTVEVVVDNTAPTKSLVTPPHGSPVSGTIALTAEANDANLRDLAILVDGAAVGTSLFSPFTVSFDTTARLDGAMQVTVVVRDLAGNTSTCTADVTVDNLSIAMTPRHLNLHSKAKGEAHVIVVVEGRSAGLLVPAAANQLELRVAGGNPVPVQLDHPTLDALGDRDLDGVPDLMLRFDRKALVASIQAGINAHLIDPELPVVVTLLAHGANVIGADAVRVTVKP